MHCSLLIATLACIAGATTTIITCPKISSDCAIACGPGYKSCGAENCYNPDKAETCCGEPPISCPSGSFCSTTNNGCMYPAYTPRSDNFTKTPSFSSYAHSGASSAATGVTNVNGTITSASYSGNLSAVTGFSSTTTGGSVASSNSTSASAIFTGSRSGGASISTRNLTYMTIGPTTTTRTSVVSPTKTGVGNLVNVVDAMVVWVPTVAGWLFYVL